METPWKNGIAGWPKSWPGTAVRQGPSDRDRIRETAAGERGHGVEPHARKQGLESASGATVCLERGREPGASRRP